MTKKQKQDAIQKRIAAQRAAQAAGSKKRNKIIAISAGAVVAVAIIIGVIVVFTSSKGNNSVPANPDGHYPQVTITMESGGVIVAELYPNIAPNTVNNFISLVKKGFYDGLIFHRVISDFMLQGGDPLGNGTGGPGYGIKGEFSSNGFKNDLKHTPGVLSMARSGAPDSAGSQFFIVVEESPWLDGEYATFGKVISGMDVVNTIKDVETGAADRPLVDQRIKSITVDTFGVDYPEPETVAE
ncbi:hypothetical protein FACS1894217_08530 [Clostridia bacterium]|nr:hypothetical protein FACS1894217_08530 [Clostridia bacterium]